MSQAGCLKTTEIQSLTVLKALPAYPASLTDVSLVLSELRPNDSGIYRCEVQHGIDDSSDAVEVKVKGERSEMERVPGEGEGSPLCGAEADA